ncbi:MAG: DUF1572 domain-containing protein [Acidobacteria bacterium]|nr:MAG: DUF1572 domain-containing protein [Acidobacteriota bacterium]
MLADAYLEDIIGQLRRLKSLADRALAQVSDEDVFAQLDEASNSIAILMKHLAGNMRSRWTDFLTTDGEKPDRQREREFLIEDEDTREHLMARWEASWDRLFRTLDSLTADELNARVTIRGESLSAMQAINRELVHYALHVGQIVLLAKHYAGKQWHSLSIPRGTTESLTE